MKVVSLSLLGLGFMVVLGGCHSPAVNVSQAHHCDPLSQHLQLEHHYHDHSLAAQVGVVRTTRARNDEGFLRVQTILENYTEDRLAINYKVEWSDEHTMTMETAGGGWNQLIFEPRESHHLVFTAPSRSAEGFRIKMARPE